MRAQFAGVVVFILLLLLPIRAAPAPGGADQPEPKPSAKVQLQLDQALALFKEGRVTDGSEQLAAALQTARANRDDAGEAFAHWLRALYHRDLKQTAQSLAEWRATEAAWKRAGNGPGQISAIAGQVLLIAGESPGDLPGLVDRAVELGRKEQKRPRAAAALLGQLAAQLYRDGHLQAPRPLLAAAVALLREHSPGSAELTDALNDYGNVLADLGEFSNARTTLEQALEIREQIPGGAMGVASACYNLGLICHQSGDYAFARKYFTRALEFFRSKSRGSLREAQCLNAMGALAVSQGDFEGAEVLLREALTTITDLLPGSSEVAHTLNNLGVVARHLGDRVAARKYYEQALEIRLQIDPVSRDVAASLVNLGTLAINERDGAGAERYFSRALEIQKKIAPDSPAAAVMIANLGTAAALRGDTQTLRKLHQQSAALLERMAPYSADLARSLEALSAEAYERGSYPEATELAERAWGILRAQAPEVVGDEARQSFAAQASSYNAQLVACYLAQKKSRAALVTLEEGRAQALRALIAERKLLEKQVPADLWTRYRLALREEERTGELLARAAAAEAATERPLQAPGDKPGDRKDDPPPPAAVRDARSRAKQATEGSRKSHTAARLAAQQAWAAVRDRLGQVLPDPGDPVGAMKEMPAGTLGLDFGVGDERVVLFTVKSGPQPEPVEGYVLPLSPEDLRTAVNDLRTALTGVKVGRGTQRVRVVGERESSDRITESARVLSAKLFPPAVRKEIAAANRLAILPDGPLWDLPFAALLLDGEGETKGPAYLGLAKPITYAQSLALYLKSQRDRPRLPKQPTVLVVGNPAFGTPAAAAGKGDTTENRLLYLDGKPPAPLPFAEQEAIGVAGLYGAQALTGGAATEAAIRARIEAADVVHLATHGYLHPYRAMSSGVLLASAARADAPPAEDGALQAWEVFNQLKLRAHLVVLSACETGLGEKVAGEGLVGLFRAFQVAGARSIVASQWQVSDASTERLMLQFHRALRAGTATDEALRQAMAAVAAEPKTAHPYFWAAFLLVGDSGADAPGEKR